MIASFNYRVCFLGGVALLAAGIGYILLAQRFTPSAVEGQLSPMAETDGALCAVQASARRDHAPGGCTGGDSMQNAETATVDLASNDGETHNETGWIEIPAIGGGGNLDVFGEGVIIGTSAPMPIITRYRPVPGMKDYKGTPVLWAAEAELSPDIFRPDRLAAADEIAFPIPGLDEPLVVRVTRARIDVNGVLGISGSPRNQPADMFVLSVDGKKAAGVMRFPAAGRSYALVYDNKTDRHKLLAMAPREPMQDAPCGGAVPPPMVDKNPVENRLGFSKRTREPLPEVRLEIDGGADIPATGISDNSLIKTPPVPMMGGIAVAPALAEGETIEDFSRRMSEYYALTTVRKAMPSAAGAPLNPEIAPLVSSAPATASIAADAVGISAIKVIVAYNDDAERWMNENIGSVNLELSNQYLQTNWIYEQSGVKANLELAASFRTWFPPPAWYQGVA